MTDIVERLRSYCNVMGVDEVTYDAANEIERLRDERDAALELVKIERGEPTLTLDQLKAEISLKGDSDAG